MDCFASLAMTDLMFGGRSKTYQSRDYLVLAVIPSPQPYFARRALFQSAEEKNSMGLPLLLVSRHIAAN
jgi:hypothetical protein